MLADLAIRGCDMRKFLSLLSSILLTISISSAQGYVHSDVAILETGNIVPGAERIWNDWPEHDFGLLSAQGVAVVANQSSLVGGRHLVDTLLASGVKVTVIFCPEHGFRGDAAAGAHVADGIDEKTGIPIVSLYGNNKKPTPEQLHKYHVDLIIFDLQDVGCRFYTYISTLHYVLEAAAENNLCFYLLDRPNPNSRYVDGPVLEEKYKSFVGMHPGVPVVYGMTIGEYAQMIIGEKWVASAKDFKIDIFPIQNYTHDSIYMLPVPPSPNLRTPQAIALYPSLCFFEGTTISVGRGTPYPFEIIGNSYKLDLRNEPFPNRLQLDYLIDMYKHTPTGKFFLKKNNFFEKLAGTARLRSQLEKGVTEEDIRASWEPGLAQFKVIRSKYLIYP